MSVEEPNGDQRQTPEEKLDQVMAEERKERKKRASQSAAQTRAPSIEVGALKTKQSAEVTMAPKTANIADRQIAPPPRAALFFGVLLLAVFFAGIVGMLTR